MRKRTVISAVVLLCLGVGNLNAGVIKVKSPGGSLVCEVADDGGDIVYSVLAGGYAVVLPSPVGIVVDGDTLGAGAYLGKPVLSKFNETYAAKGVHSTAANNYRQAIIPVKEKSGGAEWVLELRVFPDAVAYRYRVPGEGLRKISGELSAWQLPEGTTMWYQSDRKKDYEMPFAVMAPDTASSPLYFMTTATFRLPEGRGYAKISEADLIDYSDMALETRGGGHFKSRFHNSPGGWEASGEIVSPWRVVVVTPGLDGIVNTDVFRNLSPAPAPELASAEWIKPGKSTWAWMVTGSPALKDQKKWIDWTSELGFEYYLIDDGWARWDEGGVDQWGHMKGLVEYAAAKNVKLWAWVHTREVTTKEQITAYLGKAKEAGLAGLKVDFMGPADPGWVQWYDDILRASAGYELMINFHGANKPSGRERTWPHEMTREAVRGREMGKQPALHDTSLPFTRFVNGHADYTPVDFREKNLRGSTWAHELAMAVVFTSPMLVLAGDPATYLDSEARGLMRDLPSVWDETVVLPGSEIGSLAAFARRSGDEWYIGVINGQQTTFTLKTDFLGRGGYEIEEFRDVDGKNDAWRREVRRIDRKHATEIRLSGDGGYVARIRKIE